MEAQTKQKPNSPVNLVVESYQIAGARQMLAKLADIYKISPKVKGSKEDQVYVDAEIKMILSSVDNVRHFLSGDYRIHYCNHQRDKKGHLVKCEAYFAP